MASGCPALAGGSGGCGRAAALPANPGSSGVCVHVSVQGPFGRTLPSRLRPWTSQALLSAWRSGWAVRPHRAGAFFCLAFYFDFFS